MNRRSLLVGIPGLAGLGSLSTLAEAYAMPADQLTSFQLTPDRATLFARLALKGIAQEFPNKLDHVMTGLADVRSPKALHPAFYGCFDWHSSVHGHWMLVRLLKTIPDFAERDKVRTALGQNLTADHLKAETEYFLNPAHKTFERTYGWAWLLKLAEELHGWPDADGKKWAEAVKPLAAAVVDRYLAFLPKQTYPIRTGVHPNTAFGLAFALDYARAVGHKPLTELLISRSRDYYLTDVDYPAGWEPSGADFFSPALMEADLMRRVLPTDEFRAWFKKFLPTAGTLTPKRLFEPATVTDRTDPLLVHLDGLNLSRAWCLRGIATTLTAGDPTRAGLIASAARHAEAALGHVASGDYGGEHWLASFAVYLLAAEGK